jgi:hypothetical protein
MPHYASAREKTPWTFFDTCTGLGRKATRAFEIVSHIGNADLTNMVQPSCLPGDATFVVKRLEVYFFGVADVSLADLAQAQFVLQVGVKRCFDAPLTWQRVEKEKDLAVFSVDFEVGIPVAARQNFAVVVTSPVELPEQKFRVMLMGDLTRDLF